MTKRPLIVVTPSTERSGVEMQDHSITVGSRYLTALIDAGALAVCLPLSTDPTVLADLVARADGVMLTGGDDISPRVYWPEVPAKLLKTCDCAEPARDVMEFELVKIVLAQRKPLLAICRGHQLINVALGGTLIVDIPSQLPGAFKHSQMDRKYALVHDVAIAADSELAALWGQTTLGVNSTHHQAVERLAKPMRAVAHGPDRVVEAMELRPEDRGLLPWFASVQFHPERLFPRHPLHGRLFQHFVTACAATRDRTRGIGGGA